MIFCINPNCSAPENSDGIKSCKNCDSDLLIDGRYRAINILGEGGFGKTYEVIEPSNGLKPANTSKVLKVLNNNTSKARELFKQESEILRTLTHPGIPQGEDYFELYLQNSNDLISCLVMEKIEGENLEQWIENRKRPINEKRAIQWLRELLEILQEIHKHNFFHRDIKPSNIMLKNNGQLVLIDFGIARELTQTYEQKLASSQITKNHTPGYAPLEQEIGKAIPKSDFFALGRTFVYLLTTKHPQEIGSPYHDPNTNDDWDWRDEQPKISNKLATLIDWLMDRNHNKRPSNAQEIIDRLTEIERILYPPKSPKKTTLNKKSSSINLLKSPSQKNLKNIPKPYILGNLSFWHSKPVLSVKVSSDTKTLVSGSEDHTIKIWNIETEEPIKTFQAHNGNVRSIDISSDNKFIASGGDDKTVRIWELETTKRVLEFSHNKPVYSVLFDPNTKTILSGSLDKHIKLYDYEKKQITHDHTVFEVLSLAISSDSKILMFGSLNGRVQVLAGHILEGHNSHVTSVNINRDKNIIVSGSSDKTIKIWSLDKGELMKTLEGHSEGVLSTVISPDGNILFSGSKDKSIKIWDIETGQEINTLTEHSHYVQTLAISSDGKTLFSGSADCSIRVWQIG